MTHNARSALLRAALDAAECGWPVILLHPHDKRPAGHAAKYCPHGPESCKDQTQLTNVLARSRNYDELTEAWTGWHSTAKPLRKDYVRFVELANEGAKELGYADLGAMWRSGYDMPADD